MAVKILQSRLTKHEQTVVWVVGAIQFINILDFVMVMPLGPDFAKALGIPTSHIGYIGGAYTLAACLSGFAGSLYLDRLDRRRALAFAMGGLVISTALGGLAQGFGTLMAARFLAGACGGPATAIALAIVSDNVAVERRGRAMGAVNAAFSFASVLGIPAGLKLAELGGWRMPFFAVAALGLVTVLAALRIMRPQRTHIKETTSFNLRKRLLQLRELASRRISLIAFATTMTGMFGSFLIIPNLSAYIQFNLGFPRVELATLYACGGAMTFFSSRRIGILVDRYGALRVSAILAPAICINYFLLFIDYDPRIPLVILFTLMMTLNTGRFVIINTTLSKIPAPHERAAFMSLSAAIQQLGISAAAFVSPLLLTQEPGNAIGRMPLVAIISCLTIATLPVFIGIIEKRLAARTKNADIEAALGVTSPPD